MAVTIPPKPFKAPKGYNAVALPSHQSDMALFGNGASEEFWHITVPEGVPVEKVLSLNVEAVMRGEPIFQHNGISYGMQPLPVNKDAIMIQDGQSGEYQQATEKIDRCFNIREVYRKSAMASDADTPPKFTAVAAGKAKEIREQPQGLKTRNTPFGVTSLPTSDAAEDAEMLGATTVDSRTQSKKDTTSKKSKVKGSSKRKRD